MKFLKSHVFFITLFITTIAFILFSYQSDLSFGSNNDFARDVYEIIKIAKGDLTLIGPIIGPASILSGPYYYYLFVPSLLLSNFDVSVIFYFNAFLFSLAIGYFFYTISSRVPTLNALIAALSLVLLPVVIETSRHPGNGYTYIFLLIILLTIFYFKEIQGKKSLFIFGLLSGILINFHPANLLVIMPMFFYFFSSLKVKKNILFLIVGFVLTWMPVILFEVKHDFVMFKNILLSKSYLSFNSQDTIVQTPLDKILRLINIIQTRTLIYPSFLIFAGLLFLRRKLIAKEFVLLISLGISFVVMLILTNFRLLDHYLYPMSLLLFFTFLVFILRVKYSLIILGLFVLFELFNFPSGYYQKADRNFSKYEKEVVFVLDNKLINTKTNFNVLYIQDEKHLVPIGNEYRFFFIKYGLYPLSEYQYNESDILLIFSEYSELELEKLNIWEIEQFGKQFITGEEVYTIGDTKVYKFVKPQ